MKLNLGCGFDLRPGYLNVDFAPHHSPDLVGDVMRLPLRDGVADEVFAQDVLEHLPRTATREALAEWRRVTAPGGRIHARFPSLFHAVDLMRRKNTLDDHRVLLQNLYGTQAYTGDVHLTSFTDLTVARDFHDAGFRNIAATVADEWMWDVHATAGTGSTVAVFWGLGIHGAEHGEDTTWNWMDRRAEISIVNPGDAESRLGLSATVGAEHTPRGTLRVGYGRRFWDFGPGARIDLDLAVPAGSHDPVVLEARFPRVEAPGDHRALHCRLIDLRLDVS